MSLLLILGSWYNDCLELHPLLTKATTTAALGLLGDFAAQLHEARLHGSSRYEYDGRRGLANVANNFLLTAPIYHYGYEQLESLLPILSDDHDTSPSTLSNSLAALGQVAVDCVLFDALFVYLLFLSSSLIEGAGSVRTGLLPAIVSSWRLSLLTVPLEYVIFRYFPLRLRVLGMNLIDLAWDAVMSFVVHDGGGGGGDKVGGSIGGGANATSGEDVGEESEEGGSAPSSPASTPRSTPCSTPPPPGGAGAKGPVAGVDPLVLPPPLAGRDTGGEKQKRA